ncbi:ketoacyl-ACP synthase III [Thalassotalea aquiviva]|uniref:ketoacyl-ACP synthase III n=1 Tax=Thalassotalea aquiviva TaxID=3242415 RepID=UPI00352A4423
MQYAEITGWGKYTPPARLTNDDLATFVDTSDEWISTRTGIKERRISHLSTSEMAAHAAEHALASAGLQAKDIDLIVVATCSGDNLIPNTASKVQNLLGTNGAACFDLNAACSGFIYALQAATAQVRSGMAKKALVIGAERMSWYVNWAARETAVLFGDGAGAVILEASDQECGMLESYAGCDSSAQEILSVSGFGSNIDRYNTDLSQLTIDFVGPEIFKRAVKGMGKATEVVLQNANLSVEDVNLLIPHQANLRIIGTLQTKLKLTDEQCMVNIQNYGNTSAATIPMALCEALEQGKIQPGNNIMSAAFGAGLTVAASYIKWGQRVTPIQPYQPQGQDSNQSALELLKTAIEHTKK